MSTLAVIARNVLWNSCFRISKLWWSLMGKRRKYTFDYDSAVKQKLFGDSAALNIIYAARSKAQTENRSSGINVLGFSRNFSNASNTFANDRPYVCRRIAWCAHLNSWTACECRKWMWTCKQVCICENGMQIWTAWVEPSERSLQVKTRYARLNWLYYYAMWTS